MLFPTLLSNALNHLLWLLCILIYSIPTHSQNNILKANFAPSQDAFLFELEPYKNFSNYPDFISFQWTFYSVPSHGTSLLKFDLTSLPPNSKIIRAELNLFHSTNSGNQGHRGKNACYLKKITSPWTEQTVCWNTAPSHTLEQQVYLPTSQSEDQNYFNIDLTSFVKDWYNNPAMNFGMKIDLAEQIVYSSMKFYSGKNMLLTKRPELIISYETMSDSCITLQPGPESGKDAFVFDLMPATNYGDYIDFISFYWTFQNQVGSGNSLIQFDLSQLPKSIEIQHASMDLFHSPGNSNSGHFGQNACYIKKITSKWDESRITWNSAPKTSTSSQIYLQESMDPDENYYDIDITSFVKNWYEDPQSNFGMMLRLQSQNLYSSMKFCSSDHPDPSLRPRLLVCYKSITHVEENESLTDQIRVISNISDTHWILDKTINPVAFQFKLFNLDGRQLDMKVLSDENQIRIDCTELNSGLYFLQIFKFDETQVLKFIKP